MGATTSGSARFQWNGGFLMGGVVRARGIGRRASIRMLVGLVVLALVAAMASVAGAAQGTEGPPVKAAGVGTKAALESENCGPDGLLAYPYQQRAPCTRPLKDGEDNGGATYNGVDEDSIKVVVLVGTPDQQAAAARMPGGSAPVDRGSGGSGSTEDAYRGWNAVLAHSYNTWGRTVELEFVTPSGADEAGQRADALKIADMDPFWVINAAPATAGGGQVFASELVAKKIVVHAAGATNDEAARQAPYRWLGGFDSNASAVNGAEVLGKMFVGGKAQYSGDFTDEKRTFGAIHAETGIDFDYFTDTFSRYGGKLAIEPLEYPVPLDSTAVTASNQQTAPTIMAKLKDAGVTTVANFASFAMAQELFKAAESLDYHPEWFFPGMNAQDIEITARILNGLAPGQMEHVFGIGSLPLIVDGITDPQVNWFNWYWGPNQGVYAAGPVSPLYTLYAGVSLAGPKLTPKTFRQGLFAMPAFGGAASNQRQSFMFGYGRTSGLPYDEYSQVGLDYALMWWNPDEVGKGKIIFDEGTGKFMYPNDAKRYHAGQWPTKAPKLFDPSNSISKFTALPKNDEVPDYPCNDCPSSGTAS
jgi:hypothetical protein